MWCMVDWYRFRFLDLLILFLHKKSATFDLTWCSCDVQGRCNREKPACKYFHPPQHLKVSLAHHGGEVEEFINNYTKKYFYQDQLLINGRNHLALKNALAQQMQQQMIPGQVPTVVSWKEIFLSDLSSLTCWEEGSHAYSDSTNKYANAENSYNNQETSDFP